MRSKTAKSTNLSPGDEFLEPTRAADIKRAAKKTASKHKNTKKSVSLSSKVGLLFPVGRIHRLLKNEVKTYLPEDGGPPKKVRVGIGAAVYMAAVLEYLTSELLENSGDQARDSKRKRITPRHIQLALYDDEDLYYLLGDKLVLPEAGHPVHKKKAKNPADVAMQAAQQGLEAAKQGLAVAQQGVDAAVTMNKGPHRKNPARQSQYLGTYG